MYRVALLEVCVFLVLRSLLYYSCLVLELSELRLGLSYCVVCMYDDKVLFLYYFAAVAAAAAKFRIRSSNNSATSDCKFGSLMRW